GLLTEAQWEYAARGQEGREYPWGDDLPTCELTQYSSCDGNTVSVGSFSPSGDSWIGASDMAGNVWEWVNDWYDADYYAGFPSVDPTGPADGSRTVLRGGSWLGFDNFVRSAYRSFNDPTITANLVGIRCAQE
ncbi:MAG: SUMF1/EgtB/PvdO family nonheme iron enzyme, partial [Methylococcales bacterium]|nr:SUMF1/EgtB/PvdO family nonheme iron enzyme [Methylococcales bacterium]